jgi:hypothetical protein
MSFAKKLASNKMIALMKKRVDFAFQKLDKQSKMFEGEKWVKYSDVEVCFRAK